MATRRRAAAIVTMALVVAGVAVATRSEGYPERDVRVFAGTRWLVDRLNGTLVLADAVTGRATVRLRTGREGNVLDSVQSAGGAFLLDRDEHEIVAIDQKAIKLADARTVESFTTAREWIFGAGPGGAVATTLEGPVITVPEQGEVVPVELPPTDFGRMITTDGAVWSRRVNGSVERTTESGTERFRVTAAGDSVIGAVGPSAVVLDRAGRSLEWVLEGSRVDLPSSLSLVDTVIQLPGAATDCVWIGAGEQIVCVSRDAVLAEVRLRGFGFRANDRLLAADGVLAVVRRDGEVVRIDPVTGAVEAVRQLDWTNPSGLVLASDEVSIWIDDPAGATALAITERATHVVLKRDEAAPSFDADGISTPGTGELTVAQAAPVGGGLPTIGSGQPPEPDNDNIDDPPVATDDSAVTKQNGTLTIPVTANDYDPDGGPVAVSAVGSAGHGTARVLNATSIVYVPDPESTASDSFDYTIVDSSGQVDTATVTIQLLSSQAANNPPIAAPDDAATNVDRPISVDVLGNDTDPEGDALVIARISALDPVLGRAEVTATSTGRPELRITPAPGAAGRALVVRYRAEDSDGLLSNETTLTVSVNDRADGNHPPVAVADAAQVVAGSSVTIPVTSNDIDLDNDPLMVDSVRLDQRRGSVTISGGDIVYRAPASLTGPVSFTYVVSDLVGTTDTGSVLVNVVAPADQNQPPVAVPDVFNAGPGPTELAPLVNDQDPDGDPLVITAAKRTAGRGFVDFSEKRVYFTPVAGDSSPAQILYTIEDSQGLTSSATITVTVRTDRLPGGPVASNDSATAIAGVETIIPVTGNDVDPNDDDLMIVAIAGCSPADCAKTPDQSIRFIAPVESGLDRYDFTYTIANSVGQNSSAIVTVRIEAAVAENSRPTARDDTETITAGAGPQAVNLVDDDVDSDGGRENLTVQSIDGVSPPGVPVTKTSLGAIIDPPAALGGTRISFTYTVVDRDGLTDVGQVVVSVVAPSRKPPSVPGDTISLIAGERLTRDFLVAVEDPDGDETNLRLSGPPVVDPDDRALVSLARANNDHTYVITAATGQEGTADITFEVVDESGLSSPGRLSVRVERPANRAPTARDDAMPTPANTPVTVRVLDNDDDPDQDQMRVRIGRPPATAQGAAVVSASGQSIVFTPRPAFAGTASFTYIAIDDRGLESLPATVTITVQPCSDPVPSAADRPGEFTRYNTPLILALLPANHPGTLTFDNEIGGKVTKTGPGTLVFTPTAGNNNTGSFRYSAGNTCGETVSANVTIDVNRAPSVTAASFTTTVNTPLTIPLDRFAIDDERLILRSAQPTGGTTTISPDGSALTFTPTVTAATIATIAVTVADPGGLTASATLTVNITAPTNLPPSAADDDATIPPGAATPVSPLDNDRDPDGRVEALAVQLVDTTISVEGTPLTLSLSPDRRQVVVNAPAGAHGNTSFAYRAIDAAGATSNVARVQLTVNRDPRDVTLTMTVPAGSVATSTAYDPGVLADADGDETVNNVASTTDPRIRVDFLPDLIVEVTVPSSVPAGEVTVIYRIDDYFGGVGTGTLTIRVTAPSTASVPSTAQAAPVPSPPTTATPTIEASTTEAPAVEAPAVEAPPPSTESNSSVPTDGGGDVTNRRRIG